MSGKSIREHGTWAMILVLIALVFHCKNPKLDSDYYSPVPLATHFNGEHFVGSESCMECHADIYSEHLNTAHYKTSAPANSENLLGSFEEDSNILDLEHVKFTMEQRVDSFYVHTTFKNRNARKPPSRFGLVIGSGVRGQSYGTWKGDKLFQLQPSYHTGTDNWVNSPGFPSYADNDRPIRDACLKCHMTFATKSDASNEGNQYHKEKMVYGIDCERCHRPSARHVAFHKKNPEIEAPQFIMKYDTLSRQQRLDACAQCHSGLRARQLKGYPFSFLAGENLKEYSQNIHFASADDKLDVHGNQYGLLTSSKCYLESSNMNCTTCHNPHKSQRGNAAYFNSKCIKCHNSGFTICDVRTELAHSKDNNCIACHMPVKPSEVMKVHLTKTDSLQTSFYIRTHLIGIYPGE